MVCACLLLVAPLVFRAPSGPAAPEARRPHFVRRRASKPAQALRSLRRPPHQWCLVADAWFGASARCPAGPCRRPRALRPGPGLLHVAQLWLSIRNFARNSRLAVSNFEFVSLELQRFREVSKNDRDKLRAKFIRSLSHRCAWSPAAGPTNPSTPAAMGVLRHAKPSYGVSPACRSLGWRNFPRLVTARPRLEVAWLPKCRPVG